jgi:RNase H-like domain found in reverse transcriptase
VISQDNNPIAFYSRKLKPEQTRYTTTERELLSIVETLKEFRNILLGQRIQIHTNHKNLTCKNFNTKRVMRWRLLLEEYGPELIYIKGENNIVADALSRLELVEEPTVEELPKEEAASLFAGDIREFDLPTDYPLS